MRERSKEGKKTNEELEQKWTVPADYTEKDNQDKTEKSEQIMVKIH